MSTSSTSLASSVGLNSGMDIDGIISKLIAVEQQPITQMQTQKDTITKQQNTYSLVQGKVNDLLSAIKTLTTRNFDGTSIFDNLLSTSSNTGIATASATGVASPQTISLEVKSLPSKTTATSTSGVGKFDNTTTLQELGINAGNFTIFANGTPYTIAVTPNDTMASVFSAINTAVPDAAISANPTIVNGKINITYQTGANIQLGSMGDTTNFLAATNLLTAVDDGNGNLTASKPNGTLDPDAVLSAPSANLATPLTDGTFTINGVSFDSTGKSLNQLIDEINNSTAKVTATFNKGTNTFQLAAKDTGSSLMSLSDGTGNFLTAMKLVNGTDTTTSQTKGTNAEFVLNGVTMYSTSSTLDPTVTGITGVTINLGQAQPGTTIQINVQKDTSGLTDAVKTVIDKYNAAISYIDQQTDAKNGGILGSDSRLKSLRNQIRSLFSSQVNGLGTTQYDSLQQVGITTGAVGSSNGTATATLQLDTTKLAAALTADPNIVKKLFIGQDLTGALNNTSFDDNMQGAFTKVFQLLTDQTYTDASGNTAFGALFLGTTDNGGQGLFAAYQSAAQKRISALNDSITRAQDRLDQKATSLRQQFVAMDQLIGQYQSQGSALTSLTNQLNASK